MSKTIPIFDDALMYLECAVILFSTEDNKTICDKPDEVQNCIEDAINELNTIGEDYTIVERERTLMNR